MRKGLRRGRLRAGVAAGVTGLLIGTTAAAPATATPDDELIWEQGTVLSVSDGDTLNARLTSGPGLLGDRRIRTIGVQAPEVTPPVECGAAQATDRLRAQLPQGAPVQARSVQVTSNDDYSGGRIIRSLYAQDEEGNWYDTSRGTVSDGWLMWFPLAADSTNKPEWAHNLEYRVLADDAATRPQGLWTPNLCGASRYPDMNIRMWAKYYGTEEVYVQNNSPYPIDLGGWIIRDSAISAYTTLPSPSVIAGNGGVQRVFVGDLNLNNLPASNNAFEGDAVYLMEPAGGGLGTGNLRAWFPYPCNPDDCGDPQAGRVQITDVQYTEPPLQVPSAPGSVAATASTDGTGSITVRWAPPQDLGGPSVTYTVSAASPNGGTIPLPAPSGITGLEHTFTGLTLGRAYTFTVTATNSAGTSAPSDASGAVTPVGAPSAPTAVSTDARGAAVVVSWPTSAITGGTADLKYTARAVEDTTKFCEATDGVTSCVVTGLTDLLAYTFTVTASNSVGVSGPSPASAATTPRPFTGTQAKPAKPTAVTARALDGRAVVSWQRPLDTPDANGVLQPLSYTVSATPKVDGATKSCQTTGETSCVVSGLTNGTPYRFSVIATNQGGVPSDPSDPMSDGVVPWPYVAGQGPIAGDPPPDDPNPWVGGQMVELTAAADIRLGGYGFWDKESSSYVNGGSIEDRAAYLFPMDQTVAAGKKLRVRFGAVPNPKPASPANTTDLWTGQSTFIAPTGDFVELASLSRSSLDCKVTPGGSCRAAQQLSISSSPVGVTARTTPSSVTVNWGAPISRGGTAITGYTATAYDAPIGGSPIASCTAGGADRTCSFPGGIGAKYYVEVVAHNSQGTSGPSWRVLAAPRTVPSAPGNVAVSGTPGGVNVTWTPAAENGAAITKYTASAYTAGTGGKPVGTCTTSNGSLTGCTIMKLQGGTQYYIDVVATNRAGNGSPSSPRTPGTPGPGGAVSTYSKGKVTVRWDPPAPGSNTITGYSAKLYTKSKGGTKVGECSAPAGKTSCTTKKMKKRSKYYIDLTMQSAAGSFTVKPRIVTGPAKKASAPKVTSATASGRQVVVAWAPPTFNGYSYLKGYGARLYSKSKGGSVKASCSAGPSTLTCTTKSLKKKGTYYSAVRVKNSKGWSSWSKRVKVVVR